MKSAQPNVICFGEVLWDVLPNGKVAGGAPMNVAFHLNNFGVPAAMISRVGSDALGRELLDFLESKKVNTQFVQVDTKHTTGTVQVTLDKGGHAQYAIVEPVAWDFIAPTTANAKAVAEADVFLFGSLAARSPISRSTLEYLLDQARYRVFDVNLRSPFYNKSTLEQLLRKADLVKMNDDELDEIAGWYTNDKKELDKLKTVFDRFSLDAILMTKGAEGAVFFDDKGYISHKGIPITVVDTIGSGDSFLAAFLSRWLQEAPAQEGLAFACATGALVATYQGGTPPIHEQKVLDLLSKN